MLDAVLTKKNVGVKTKITVKMLVSAGIIALAVILPLIVHAAAGPSGGARWLPMYLPTLLGGCLLGWAWGLGVGVLSPLVSFAITYAFGDPMPAAARLPFMMAELGVFAAVSGLFSKKIARNGVYAFPAVLTAQICGRAVFFVLVLIFQALTPFTPAAILSQIQSGLLAIVLQAALVPLAVIGLRLLLIKDNNNV